MESAQRTYRSHAEVVEDLGAPHPRVGTLVFVRDLVVEAVDAGDLTTLVVASKKGYLVRIARCTGDRRDHQSFKLNNSWNVSQLAYPRST